LFAIGFGYENKALPVVDFVDKAPKNDHDRACAVANPLLPILQIPGLYDYIIRDFRLAPTDLIC
jgi:hypothetical protein